jgi:DNA-binding NarL/FixJ family response regulator
MQDLRLVLAATDPITMAGARAFLAEQGRTDVLDEEDYAHAQAVLVLAAVVDGSAIGLLERDAAAADGAAVPAVVVAHSITQTNLVRAIGYGLVCFLPRAQTTLTRAMQAVHDSLSGRVDLPAHVVTCLTNQIRLGRKDAGTNPAVARFSRREQIILAQVAEGLSTAEIAAQLNFSERTSKSALHDAIVRRNRAHAVAYALRTEAN